MRTRILQMVCGGLVIMGAGAFCAAQDSPFPSRPLRFVVPFAPGGGQDMTARTMSSKLAEALGQQVVIDNRPGANGVIASEIVARSGADGHTLYLASTSFMVAPSLARKLPFDPVRDFAPVTRVSSAAAMLVVHPAFPARSVAELIGVAKAKPGTLTFGSAGIGASSHLSGELFKMLAGVSLIHVPYKGAAISTTAVLAQEVTMTFTNSANVIGHGKAGRLRLLGVTTAQRSTLFPDLPTSAEAGVPGFENALWNGILMSGRTPSVLVARMNREVRKVLALPEVVDKLTAEGATPYTEEPPQYAQFLAGQFAKWAKVVKAAGVRPE